MRGIDTTTFLVTYTNTTARSVHAVDYSSFFFVFFLYTQVHFVFGFDGKEEDQTRLGGGKNVLQSNVFLIF